MNKVIIERLAASGLHCILVLLHCSLQILRALKITMLMISSEITISDPRQLCAISLIHILTLLCPFTSIQLPINLFVN